MYNQKVFTREKHRYVQHAGLKLEKVKSVDGYKM